MPVRPGASGRHRRQPRPHVRHRELRAALETLPAPDPVRLRQDKAVPQLAARSGLPRGCDGGPGAGRRLPHLRLTVAGTLELS